MEDTTIYQNSSTVFKDLESGGGIHNLVAVASTVAVIFFIYGLHRKVFSLNLPPGPPSWPIVGSLGLLLGDKLPHCVFWDLSKVYGPLMYMRLGSVPTLVVTSPKMASELFLNHDRNFASRPASAASEIMGRGKSITFSHGGYWRYTRNIATRQLLTKSRVNTFSGARREEMVGVYRSLVEASKAGKSIVVRDIVFPFITSTFSQMMLQRKRVFGKGQEQRISLTEKQLQDKIIESVILFGVMDIGDYIPILKHLDLQGYRKRMKQIKNDIDDVMDVVLEERRKAPAEGRQDVQDYVDVLLSLPGLKGASNVHEDILKILPMVVCIWSSISFVGSRAKEMLVAANDSTSATIEWTLLRLVKHPEIQAKIQQEIDSVIGGDRLIEESDLPKLKYLEATVKEVLRLHPPSPLLLPHQSLAPCTVAGYHIPAKTQLFINVYAIGRDPNVWENADTFLPERFLEGHPKSTPKEIVSGTSDPQFDYMPFGWGSRSCPGINLGYLTVRLTIAQIVHGFEISLAPNTELDMREQYGIVIIKLEPLELIAAPRATNSFIKTLN